jgi:hypothetical protein
MSPKSAEYYAALHKQLDEFEEQDIPVVLIGVPLRNNRKPIVVTGFPDSVLTKLFAFLIEAHDEGEYEETMIVGDPSTTRNTARKDN